jgi:hypothetical protein
MILQKGAPAPDPDLKSTPDQKLKSSDFSSNPVILTIQFISSPLNKTK